MTQLNPPTSLQRVSVARSVQFRREREHDWEELESMIKRIDASGVKALDAAELGRLPQLYRAALSALNVARATSLDRHLVAYLEALSARSYLSVYATRQRPLKAISRFVRADLPLAVWRARHHLALSTGVVALGALAAGVMVGFDIEAFETFVSAAYAQGRGAFSTPEELRQVLFSGHDLGASELAEFSGFLLGHNARIGIMCFALSFALGLPTLYLLFKNGAVLGAFAALHAHKGLSVEFFSWLLPHGVTEILAVLLCGAAGLMVAEAVLFPGPHSRAANLAKRGREAGVIVIGAVALFALAALLEGVFRQLVQSIPVRYLVASLTALIWALYFGAIGRRQALRASRERLEAQDLGQGERGRR